MDEVSLLYVENTIMRKKTGVQQQLVFFMRVSNIAYDKRVDVLWAGENGVWHTLPASFHSQSGHHAEYWQANICVSLSKRQSLPGNIQFGLRYRTASGEFWANNFGKNYSSQADSGIRLEESIKVLQVNQLDRLMDGQKNLPITVAVDRYVDTDKVTIHWTTDDWQHVQQTACHFRAHYWDKSAASNARNVNQYGTAIWKTWLRLGQAFRIQYCISVERDGHIYWDNNQGGNYCFSRAPLRVLILNLHCYQEDHQDYKLSQIARAINDLKVDIVCLQEVAEPWNDGSGNWDANAAKIIRDQLMDHYYIHTDWSHLGFDQYREGVAILSRFPPLMQDARYVSENHDVYSIHSRKVVMMQVNVPYVGLLNLFSVHLSWWEDGFAQQFKYLCEWAECKRTTKVDGTLLCGDFNITAGTQGYRLVVDTHQYDDQYLAANSQGLFEKIFRVDDPHWRDYPSDDYRIDYVFLHKDSRLQVVSANVLFTEHDYGRVSDHCGYLMVFEPSSHERSIRSGN